jgi:hypothetical protein
MTPERESFLGAKAEATCPRRSAGSGLTLLRTTDVANRCPPSYARSTPPAYLEPAAPPQERRRQRRKHENNDIFDHAEAALFPRSPQHRKNLSGVNDEQC